MTSEQAAFALRTAARVGAVDGGVVEMITGNHRRLGWMANRCTGAEGSWQLTNIEGSVPPDLHGELYRVAPGQKVNHGVQLMDFFDGDAFISRYSFRHGRVSLRAGFVSTPERLQEIGAGRMIYNEFGTRAPSSGIFPKFGPRWKNPPSINVIKWDGRLLGLSEGGHPTAVNEDLSFQSQWDFHGTLPPACAFTAHPRFDPVTGEGYAYGYTKVPFPTLRVFRMELDGRLTQLYRLRQGKYFMVHDMILTENYIVLVIPPVKLDLFRVFFLPETLAENLRYFSEEKTRILVLRRDGTGVPMSIELDPNMVFHHGNGYEAGGNIVFDSLMYPDGSILDLVRCWSAERPPRAAGASLSRIEINLSTVDARKRDIDENLELPRFNGSLSGSPSKFLYSTRSSKSTPGDPYGCELVKTNVNTGASQSYCVRSGQEVLGEPVFSARDTSSAEDDGWILILGYSGDRDQTFLEIIDAESLTREARVWTGTHLPLGFHGNYYPAA